VIPITGKRLSIGGLLLVISISTFTFGSIGYWYPAEYAYWNARGALFDWTTFMYRVVWTGVTGHWCDILIGLVMIPVGRNSVLARVFHLHTSTLLFAHKVLAYALCVGALVHGISYYVFVAAVASSPPVAMHEFLIDNPMISVAQSTGDGPLSFLVLPTGVISFVLILVVVITSLSVLRRKKFNTFYFVHISVAVIILILTCLHASTNFYCLLPGLLLWAGDWVWRLCNALAKKTEATVENAGNGWYRVRLPPKHAGLVKDVEKSEAAVPKSGSDRVLATYYINFPSVSKLQIHPFTAATAETTGSGPVLLFQRGPERKKSKQSEKEWTWALATRVDASWEKRSTLDVRIEGPYSPFVPEMYTANHTLLLVGGTGITGALTIANWWAKEHGSRADQSKSLHLIWTVRTQEMTSVDEVQDLQTIMAAFRNMEFVVHVSSELGRLQPASQLSSFLASRVGSCGARALVYVSGPDGLIQGTETACVEYRRGLRRAKDDKTGLAVTELDCYVARWSL
ncbi:hypothetical protein B0A49_12684, partial [Cryomyces minteri]